MDIHRLLETKGETRCLEGVSLSCFASSNPHRMPTHIINLEERCCTKGYIFLLLRQGFDF